MPPEVAEFVFERDRWCQARAFGWADDLICHGRLVLHHRLPRSAGGRDTAENLVVLCGGVTGRDGHHGAVHDWPERSYRLGLLLRRGST